MRRQILRFCALLLFRLHFLPIPFVSCLFEEPQRNEIRNKTKQNTRKTLPMYKTSKTKRHVERTETMKSKSFLFIPTVFQLGFGCHTLWLCNRVTVKIACPSPTLARFTYANTLKQKLTSITLFLYIYI